MKDVKTMTIEECEQEVCELAGGSDTICYTMDSADKAIMLAGTQWEKYGGKWRADPLRGNRMITTPVTKAPALDLWRLAVLVWRAKSSPKAGGEGR